MIHVWSQIIIQDVLSSAHACHGILISACCWQWVLRQVLWVSSSKLRHSIALICDDLLTLNRLAREAVRCAHSSEHSIPVARHDSFHFTFSGEESPQLLTLYLGLQCLNVSVFELPALTCKSRCSYWYWLEVELGHSNFCAKITQKISGRVFNSINVFLSIFFLFWLK